MKKLLYVFFIGVLFSACSVFKTPGLKPRNVDQYYVPTGIEKYFLADIPDWVNFSQSGECFRTKGLRYFDIGALMKSYTMKYRDAIEIQATFNEEYLAMKKQTKASSLSLKDEENLFFRSSDKVNSKIVFFDAPIFRQIHLIWLDEALKGKKEEERLRAFVASAVHDEGLPVLVSSCLNKEQIEARFPALATKVISAELFSSFNELGEAMPSLHLNIDTFFTSNQKIIFYTQTKKHPEDIRGNFKRANY